VSAAAHDADFDDADGDIAAASTALAGFLATSVTSKILRPTITTPPAT